MASKQQGKSRTQILTPHAALIVWNYKDRLSNFVTGESSTSPSDVNAVDEKIISTVSLASISTTKTKASPVGAFSVALAPTKNWVSAISPGSWCAILMSHEKITADDFKIADEKKLKMIGKITSVRVNTSIDQQTGARKTFYTLQGEDWGHVFNNAVYIDPAALRAQDKTPGVAQAIIEQALVDAVSGESWLTTSSLCKRLITLWGEAISSLDSQPELSGKTFVAENSYTLPQEFATFLGKASTFGAPDNPKYAQVSQILIDDLKFGRCIRRNPNADPVYEEVSESIGIYDPDDFINVNTTWSLLDKHQNKLLNELFCDLDFEGGKPKLRLWKRIKPFTVTPEEFGPSEYIKSIGGLFTDLPNYEIPLDQVIHFDAATNWRDKVNFVEIRLADAFGEKAMNNQLKNRAQRSDRDAFQREGFRPMALGAPNIAAPVSSDREQSLYNTADWSDLLKSWFFDTHRMLNGTMTIIGQNKHIPVGSNILIDAKVAGDNPNLNTAQINGQATHILAHVVSVSHKFTVDSNGTRRFLTDINFVRGIITDRKGRVVSGAAGDSAAGLKNSRINKLTTDLNSFQDKNRNTTFATSTDNDPDGKVRGT